MAEVTAQALATGPGGVIEPSRVRAGVVIVAGVMVGFSVPAAFTPGAAGALTFVAALCAGALVVLLVAMEHPRQARAWRFVGSGITLWAVGGFLLTLREDAGIGSVPSVAVALCLTVGYLPLLLGLAELCDPQLRARRLTSAVDGVLLFLTLYAVLWLLVVEPVSETSLPKLNRAFDAVYPAGDLAVCMLAVRIVASRVARRRVGLLLLGGAALLATSDIARLVVYLRDPKGSYPLTDLAYLLGVSSIALAAVWSLLPVPPTVTSGAASSRRLALMVAVSSLAPPLVLGGVVLFTDREVALGPIAAWILLTVATAVMRHVASVRELERAHEQSRWLASHDPSTDFLYRSAFLHEVSEGGMRDRSGTVLLLEAQSLREVRDARGYEAAEFVLATMAARLHAAVGEAALCSALAPDQFVAFIRNGDLARGRQVAASLQRTLAVGVAFGDVMLDLPAVVGLAQADGAVIDVVAAVRRAAEAARVGRAHGAGYVAVDADLTGSAAAVSSPAHPSRREPSPSVG
ncbi:MAG: diguanylate cyclase [Ilumatobacteraceae bacterium]